MQYKPNLPENQVNANSVLAKGYEADIVFWHKNPKANFQNAQINITTCGEKNYENNPPRTTRKNKANSNPIKPKTKPIKPNQSQFQTQFKPNSKPIQSQFKANSKPIFPKNRHSAIENRKSALLLCSQSSDFSPQPHVPDNVSRPDGCAVNAPGHVAERNCVIKIEFGR